MDAPAPAPTALLSRLTDRARAVEARYAGEEDRPLASFVGAMATYGAVAAGLGVAAARRGRLPVRIGAGDLALLAVATHRLSRTLAKDPVTSPLRAPFTRLEGTTGPAELKETVHGTGTRHALGELLTCPFCLAQWVATGFVGGLLLAPGPTRALASVFTTVAGADVLHLAYSALQRAVDGDRS